MYMRVIDWGERAVFKAGDADEHGRVGVTCLGLTQYSVTLQHSSITYDPEWTR